MDLDASFDQAIKKIFTPKRTPQQYLLVAVSDSDADRRREAVVKVAESKKRDQEWALKGFIAMSMLESDPQTRCIAIRALSGSDDPRAAEVLLKILNYQNEPPAEIRPPTAVCAWEAAAALASLSARGVIPQDKREHARETFERLLESHRERHVRISSARGLGFYQQNESVEALIAALRDRDFAVVHTCEEALVRLTGHTENCVAHAWEEWYKQNKDNVFAHAGEIPESRRKPYATRWGKFLHNTKQIGEWLIPSSK